MWVHDIILRRQKYTQYYRRGREKEKKGVGDVTSTFLKSWDFQLKALGAPDLQIYRWKYKV